jgi:hypothetical protein
MAGYVRGGYRDPDFLESLPVMKMPDVRGEQRWFEVVGDSMETNFYERDLIGCTRLYSAADIKYGNVHVLVTSSDGIVLKRIFRHDDPDCVNLVSDNKFYPDQPLKKDNILEIWYFRRRYTAQAPLTSNTEERLLEMEKDLSVLKQAMRDLLTVTNTAAGNARPIDLDLG